MTERAAPVCNIGPRGARTRIFIGLALLVCSIAAVLWTSVRNSHPWWQLGHFPILWLSVFAFLEGRARICVVHALKGTSDSDTLFASIDDPEAQAALRLGARRIAVQSAAIAAVLAAVAFSV